MIPDHLIPVYDLEGAIAAAAAAALELPESVETYTPRSQDEIKTPCVRITFTSNGATPERYASTPEGKVQSIWTGTLTCTVATDRRRSHALHGLIRACLRYNLRDWVKLNSILTLHEVLRIVETGSTETAQAEDNLDLSAVTFQLIVGVRQPAWTAPTPPPPED